MMLMPVALPACLFAVPAQVADAVSLACGGAEMTIACRGPAGNADCTRTALRLRPARGATRQLPQPAEFAASRTFSAIGPTGLSCGTARSGAHYFVVDYGELPFGCDYCEWFKVYALDGAEVTRNAPAILTDSSLPEGRRAYPNNREYAALRDRLGLKTGDNTSVQCNPKPSVPAGQTASECTLKR